MTARFRQADIQRAIKPALKLGLTIARYEIGPGGEIVVYTAEGGGDSADAALVAWERANAKPKA